MVSHNGDLSAQIREVTLQAEECVDVVYPEVELRNQAVANRINAEITRQVNALSQSDNCQINVTGRYEVNVNEKGVLSINLQFYRIPVMAANGLNIQKSINVALATGKNYRLNELFRSDSHYRIRLNEIIKRQIEERDIPMIKEFTGISDYEDYYLTEDSLVVYFQELEYTIHAYGIPEFVIPYRLIDDIIREDALIGMLLSEDSRSVV